MQKQRTPSRIRRSAYSVGERIRHLAELKARKYGTWDKTELANDLEMEGWVGYLSDTRTDENLKLRRAEDFMNTEWFRARYWKNKGHWRTPPQFLREVVQMNFLDYCSDDTPNPEEQAIQRDLCEKLIRRLERRGLDNLVSTLRALLWDEKPKISSDAMRRFNLRPNDNAFRKKVIRETAAEILFEEA